MMMLIKMLIMTIALIMITKLNMMIINDDENSRDDDVGENVNDADVDCYEDEGDNVDNGDNAAAAEDEIITAPQLDVPWRSILKSPCFWAIAVGHFVYDWGFFQMISNLPIFLYETMNFDIKSVRPAFNTNYAVVSHVGHSSLKIKIKK